MHVQGAYGASLGSVTELAKLQGAKAKSYRIALASSLAAAQARPASSDLSVPTLQSFASVVSRSAKVTSLQQGERCLVLSVHEPAGKSPVLPAHTVLSLPHHSHAKRTCFHNRKHQDALLPAFTGQDLSFA